MSSLPPLARRSSVSAFVMHGNPLLYVLVVAFALHATYLHLTVRAPLPMKNLIRSDSDRRFGSQCESAR